MGPLRRVLSSAVSVDYGPCSVVIEGNERLFGLFDWVNGVVLVGTAEKEVLVEFGDEFYGLSGEGPEVAVGVDIGSFQVHPLGE